LQDDGQEIRQGGRDQVQQEKQTAESVYLGVEEVHQHLGPGERLGNDVVPVGLDPPRGHQGLRLGEEVETPLRVLGEIDHPPVRHDSYRAGDESLDQEHPPPARQPGAAVEMVEPVVDDAAGGEDQDLTGLEKSKAELLLLSRVPGADQICQAGVDPGHGDAQQDTQHDHLLPCPDERGAEGDQSEAEGDEREPDARTDEAHCKGRGELEDHAGDGEDEYRDGVAVALQVQVAQHAGHRRGRDDARVEEVQTAENAGDCA